MDIDDQLSDQLRQMTKGDEKLDLEGFWVEFTGEGNGIFQIKQGSSEASSSSKEPIITIEHLSSTLLSKPEVSQTSKAK
jgi:hypothetical protein